MFTLSKEQGRTNQADSIEVTDVILIFCHKLYFYGIHFPLLLNLELDQGEKFFIGKYWHVVAIKVF